MSYHNKVTIERSRKVTSLGGYDETTTPEGVTDVICGRVPEDHKVWCPCDTIDSPYVKSLYSRGNYVIHTSKEYHNDFLYCEPDEDYDIIVTTPPFSTFSDFVKRALELGKPFIFLSSVEWLLHSDTHELFNQGMKITLIPERVSYIKNNKSVTSSFISAIYSKGV